MRPPASHELPTGSIPPPVAVVDRATYRLSIRIFEPAQLHRLASLVARALDGGEYEPGMEISIDCRGCEAPDSPTIRALAAAIGESRDVIGPVAILTDDVATYGMGRMLEIMVGLRGDAGVRVFLQEPQLESWLRQAGVTACA